MKNTATTTGDRQNRHHKELVTAAKGGGGGILGVICSRVLALLLQAAIARLFGVTYFGYYVTGIMFCRVLQVFAGLGLSIGGIRYMVQSMTLRNYRSMFQIYWVSIFSPFLAGSFLGFLFYLTAPFLSNHIFSEPDLLPVLQLFAIAVPWLALLRILAELSRSFGTVRYTVIIEDIVFPLMQMCILLFAFISNGNKHLSVVSFVIATFLCAIIMSVIVYQQIRRHIFTWENDAKNNSTFRIRELFHYSIPLMPTGIFFMVSNNIDILMLNLFNSGGAVGIYAAATRWTLLVDSIGTPVYGIFRPLIAKAISTKDSQMLRSLLMASTRWVLYLCLPCIACLLVASQPAMNFFIKEDILGISSILLWVLLLARAGNPLGNGAGLLLAMGGQQYKELTSLVCGAVLNVVLNVILIPRYGVIGAAIATGAGFYLTTGLRIFFVWRRWDVVPWSKRMIVPVSALCIVILIHLLTPPVVPLSWQIGGGGISAFFVAFCILLFGWEQDDKNIALLLPRSVQNIYTKMLSILQMLTSKFKS